MRSTKILAGVVIVIIGAGAIVVGALSGGPVADESPLKGELDHDFGEVAFDGLAVKLEHVFALTNESDRTVRISKIAPTCGCTIGDVSRKTIEPGQSTEVTVTLTLSQPGRRTESVWLGLEDIGAMALGVSGTARRIHDFYAMQSAVLLTPGIAKEIVLVATDRETDIKPVPPTIAAPEGVSASFHGWQLVFTHDVEMARPARWQAIVTLSQTVPELPPGTKLPVKMGVDRQMQIDLTGRPWARPPEGTE